MTIANLLSSGRQMPVLGLGVYEMSGREAYSAVLNALKAGYRLNFLRIDSAEWYSNERECGQAIRDFVQSSDVPRESIFYTTKIKVNSTEKHAAEAIDKSLKLAGLDYFDLYLIHGPYPDKDARLATWRALERAVGQGKVRSIGVSNYGIRHLEELAAVATIQPAVNQIDLHPFMRRFKDVEFCENRGIHLQAWGPLVRGERFSHPQLVSIAQKHDRTAAQCLLRWGLQKGFSVIPKSTKLARIRENANVFDFELDATDVQQLDELDEYLVTDWDPIGDRSV